MKTMLLEVKVTVVNAQPEQDHLPPDQISAFEGRYDVIVTAGLAANSLPEQKDVQPRKRGKPKQHPAKNLVDHKSLAGDGWLEPTGECENGSAVLFGLDEDPDKESTCSRKDRIIASDPFER